MDHEQARNFIKSNGHPKLWGYDEGAGKWTFAIRPWLSIRLHPASVTPADATLTESWPAMRDETGNPLSWEVGEFGFYERESLVLTCQLLRLPGIVTIPMPLPGSMLVTVEGYQFARCLERTGGPAGDDLLERTMRYLGLALAPVAPEN